MLSLGDFLRCNLAEMTPLNNHYKRFIYDAQFPMPGTRPALSPFFSNNPAT